MGAEMSDLERIEAFVILLAVAVEHVRARTPRGCTCRRGPDPRLFLTPTPRPKVPPPPPPPVPDDEAEVRAAWAVYRREHRRYVLEGVLKCSNRRKRPEKPYRLPCTWGEP